jgi:hypothetical protein
LDPPQVPSGLVLLVGVEALDEVEEVASLDELVVGLEPLDEVLLPLLEQVPNNGWHPVPQ